VDDLTATGHDSRIDLEWTAEVGQLFDVYRATDADGPFTHINENPVAFPVYSDFLGNNDLTRFYQVRLEGSAVSTSVVSATTRAMTDDELLTSVQEATFRFFWQGGHPVSGVTREGFGFGHPGHVGALGGTGMGLMAITVGADRSFVTRAEAAERVLTILTFFEEKVVRHHGAWPHWFHAESGATIAFSQKDNGGDLVETALFLQGVLVVRQYFDGANATEIEIGEKALALWEGVEWDHYVKNDALIWHWSPDYGFEINMLLRGFYEAQITYILAVASPQHAVPATLYSTGWISPWYDNGNTFYDITLDVGPDYGGPMFWTHYSYMGFDPRRWDDGHANYFDHGRNVALIHKAYAQDNPLGHEGYGGDCWGLTAGPDPDGYRAHNPTPSDDNGTIAPTAALSSMPYTPEASMAALRHFYHDHGAQLWGDFGFKDGFNEGRDWHAQGYLAIDQAPIIVMIENFRTGLCWNMFMKNPEIEPALVAMGWEKEEVSPFHTADQDTDSVISLSELLRVIQFYNSSGFHCQEDSEDGYAPGAGETSDCIVHASDYNPRDWEVNLNELLRVVQLFNSGTYHLCSIGEQTSTEDLYCPVQRT
jgi:hypothetical protein